MKERDTVILPVRIKKSLDAAIKERVTKKGVSRNSWVIKALKNGLRSHKAKVGERLSSNKYGGKENGY